LYFVLIYPLFSWMYANPSFTSLLTTQVALCCLIGAFAGPMSTALAEQFKAHVRSTGLGIAYNTAVMLFGGFAPFFVTWLIQTTGLPVAPAFYVMFGAAIGLLASLLLRERPRDVDLTADLEVALS
jgi:MHS family proline/betaine transporter-like MFS transporter